MRRAQGSLADTLVVRALWRRRTAGEDGAAIAIPSGVLCRCISVESATAAANTSRTSTESVATHAASHPQRRLRLAVVRPDLLDDWIPELNDVDAQNISCTDDVASVWWCCPRCHERYQSTVQSRVARGRAACPHCSGLGNVEGKPMTTTTTTTAASSQARDDATTAAAATGRAEAPLAVTHSALAARWDEKRNGGPLPEYITATSTQSAWWRPAPHSSASSRSFRRPVFAFVRDPASPGEQMAATAAMEWRLLASIREVARIAVAERLGSMPVTLSVDAAAAAGDGHAEVGDGGRSRPVALHDPAVWREAAREVDAEAEEHSREAHLNDDDHTSTGDSQGSDDALSSSASSTPITVEDAAAVAFLWKPRVKRMLPTMQQYAQSQHSGSGNDSRTSDTEEAKEATPPSAAAPSANLNNAAASPLPPRELFARSFSESIPSRYGLGAAASAAETHRDTASIVRETLLNQYCDFVHQQRATAGVSASSSSPPPVLRLDGAADTAADDSGSAAPASWLDFFRLTEEEVLPRGYIDPSASLYFSNVEAHSATSPSAGSGADAVSLAPTTSFPARPATRRGRDAVKKPPVPPFTIASDAELVFAYYPRPPRFSPAWEDDVTESVPPMPSVATAFSTATSAGSGCGANNTRVQRALYGASFRIEAPFGCSAAADDAAQLAAEYDNEDVADVGVALASELRAGEAGSAVDIHRDGSVASATQSHVSSSGSGSSISLVNSAIAALGSAFQPIADADGSIVTEAGDVSRRRRHRGVQPSNMPSDHKTAVTGAQQPHRKFRLSMPQAGLGGSLGWRSQQQKRSASSESSEADAAEKATPSLQFEAPRSPRKVARPRRLRKNEANDAT